MIEWQVMRGDVIKVTLGEPDYPLPSKLLNLPLARLEVSESSDITVDEVSEWFKVSWRGKEVLRFRGELSNSLARLELTVPRACRVYGLGERHGCMDRRGRRLKCWNVDQPMHLPVGDPTYMCVPYALIAGPGTSCYAVLIDYGGYMEIDVCREREGVIRFESGTNGLIAYVVIGESPKELLSKYSELVGRPKLPPKWVLGYHQSRYSYMSADEVIDLVRRFRELGIPLDAVYLDIDYMDSYKVFTWDPKRFPNPDLLIKELEGLGVKLVTILDVGVKVEDGYDVYEEGLRRDAFIKSSRGGLFKGAVWPGVCVFPDFLREDVRDWWAELISSKLLGFGVAGIWLDMNEPAIFYMIDAVEELTRKACSYLRSGRVDEAGRVLREAYSRISTYGYPWVGRQEVTAIHEFKGSRVPHEKVRNVYGALEVLAAAKAFSELRPGERSFILTRTGWAGTQALAAVWTGDNQSCWEHLRASIPELLSLSLQGFTLIGADVGGFEADTSPELLLRWLQLGAFYPLYRNHSSKGTLRQEPWVFGGEWLKLMREAIKLRYEFLPHIYSSLVRSVEEGLPLMRPLMIEFPEDELSYVIEDEFMVGDSLLVAPVTEPGARARAVYLPECEWVEFSVNNVVGPGWVMVKAPLSRVPLFIRRNHAVLTTKAGSNAYDSWDPLYVNAFPDPVAEALVYDDDGESMNYLRGSYFKALISIKVVGDELIVNSKVIRDGFKPGFNEVVVRLINKPLVRGAKVNGVVKHVDLINDVPELVVRASELFVRT